MTSEQNRSGNPTARPRPTRAQRIVAAGFLGAFGLTIITVLLTGLWVRSPTRRGAQPPAPAAERGVTVPAETPEPVERGPERDLTGAGAPAAATNDAPADEPHDHANENAASEQPAGTAGEAPGPG